MGEAASPPVKNGWSDVLAFWFIESGPKKWFGKDPEFDRAIRDRFADLHRKAMAGELRHWETEADGTLALVILLDQFPRNMFRDQAQAFASDAPARAVASRALARGHDQVLPAERRSFLYMPFMHSEALEDQERCVALYDALNVAQGKPVDANSYARRHRDIIRRFGRFPHRNAVLGRISTAEETAFLAQPGSSF